MLIFLCETNLMAKLEQALVVVVVVDVEAAELPLDVVHLECKTEL
jgi:hypothetical protein